MNSTTVKSVSATQTVLPSPTAPQRNSVMGLLRRWLQPKATNRDEAFRERTMRLVLLIMISFTLLNIGASIFVFHDKWNQLVSYPTMNAGILGTLLLTAVLITRQRLTQAGWTLTLMTLGAASMIVYLAAQSGSNFGVFMGIPVFMMAILLGALVMPRRNVLPVSLVSIVTFAVLLIIFQLQDFHLQIGLAQIGVSNATLVLAEGLFLWLLRGEFDARLDGMRRSNEQMKEAREQAEADRLRAENADRAKSQFLANMSHELRTPLNAIIGYDEAMIGGMAGDFTEAQTRLLTNIQNNSRRLLGLINDILDLSKIESGNFEIFLAPMPLRKTVREVVDNLQGLVQQKHIDLKVEFSDAVPELILGDAKKIQQIVTNLVGNAVKFTPKGEVLVEVSMHDTDTWQLQVRDTGIGMPPVQRPIFSSRSDRWMALPRANIKALAWDLPLQNDW